MPACRNRDVEVQQQAQRLAGGFEIGDHRGDVDGEQLRDRLELHHELISHHQVQLGRPNRARAIADGNGYLPSEGDAPVGQLQTERLVVDRFEETRGEGAWTSISCRRTLGRTRDDLFPTSTWVRIVGAAAPGAQEGARPGS